MVTSQSHHKTKLDLHWNPLIPGFCSSLPVSGEAVSYDKGSVFGPQTVVYITPAGNGPE